MPHRIYGPGAGEPETLRAVPDLAGLPVDDADGEDIGRVYGSLVDADSGLVRYLDLYLDGTDRHVLVPIGHSRIRDEGPASHVHLRAAVRDELADIPPHEPQHAGDDYGKIGNAYQRRLLAAHGRLFKGARYYAHPAFDHSGLYAGDHPIVRAAEDGAAERDSRLRPLSQLPGFHQAPGAPDIRGWPLISTDDEVVGTIEDLLIDPVDEKIRYVLTAPRRNDARSLLLPTGFLRILPERNQVNTTVLTRNDLRALPPAPDGSPTRAWEARLRRALEDRLDGARLFQRPDYNRTDSH